MKSRSIRIDNSQLLNISVKADNDNERYVLDSDFSENVACQFYSILQKPTVAVSVNGANCIINITPQGSTTYLSGFAIYFDNYKYTTISQDVKVLQIPIDIIKTSGIRVQALSSNNNCYSSNLSDVKYIERNVNTLSVPTVKFAENQLTWENVENATRYYVEVSNKIFRHSEITTQTKLDLSNICNYGEYSVNVIAMDDYNGVENYNQSQASLTINYNLKLQQVTNVNIVKQADKTYLEFDGDANAYGYVMYLNNVMKDKLFISSPIDISGYVSVATSYNINVQAISVGVDAVESGEKSDQQVLQNIKTLSSPKLTITTEGNKYYLNIDVDENEASIASGYELWINYTSVVVETEFKDSVKEISSYFANAGEYSFMIQAKADKSNSNVKDSPMASIVFKVTKQLDVVTDILVQKSNEDKYILTFNEQTFAAKYLVTIKKAEDEQFVKQFELTSGYADISQYIIENGVYRVYVKAMALEGGSYTDSADSGNPYRVVKGETLSVAQNITFEKKSTNAGEIFVKWSKVENAIGYQVYVYYNEDGNNVLKESVYVAQTNEPSLNIGSGEYKCVGKEGDYSVQIKALGDNIAYENSQLSSSAYSYVMEKIVDFKRYSVFMYGNNYTYYVTKLDDLKNLLWYHYLYNKDTWIYNNSLEYNFKVYFDDSITITGKDSEGNDIKLDP
ncbi:MAG: hypothetical protein IJA72_04330, partial [Clostridia bacterium]|nr:hypothetical protein [Clostridia bacterium]